MTDSGNFARRAIFWLKLLAPALAGVTGLVVLKLAMPHFVNQQFLSEGLRRLGRWAPIAFVALLAVRPVTLLPGQLLAAVGGLLFGTLWGSIYALAGSFFGSCLIYWVSRKFGPQLMKRLAREKYPAVVKSARKHGLQFAILSTLNPLFPTDIALAVAFASKARFWPMALGVVAGSTPGTFLTAQFGSALGQGKTILTTVSALGLVVSLVLGVILGKKVYSEIASSEVPARSEASRESVSARCSPYPG